jgi:hypothetical protein
LTQRVLFFIIASKKEASGLRLLSRLHGVQKVGSSNLPAPTITSSNTPHDFLHN